VELLDTKHDKGNQNMGAEQSGNYGKHQHKINIYNYGRKFDRNRPLSIQAQKGR
jgi:hypothetical protein